MQIAHLLPGVQPSFGTSQILSGSWYLCGKKIGHETHVSTQPSVGGCGGCWTSNGLTAVEAAATDVGSTLWRRSRLKGPGGESLLFLRFVIVRLQLASLKCGCFVCCSRKTAPALRGWLITCTTLVQRKEVTPKSKRILFLRHALEMQSYVGYLGDHRPRCENRGSPRNPPKRSLSE